jgi:catechol 2,3-dioxygenase-like lactoylglutathione lyase family enzyme
MSVNRFDHVYLETRDWEASCAFWLGLGFRVAEEWGSDGHRAARLASKDASIVLAEAKPGDRPAVFDVLFKVDSFDGFDPRSGVEVVSGPTATHRGTRMRRVKDPEGRVYSLEDESGGGA